MILRALIMEGKMLIGIVYREFIECHCILLDEM